MKKHLPLFTLGIAVLQMIVTAGCQSPVQRAAHAESPPSTVTAANWQNLRLENQSLMSSTWDSGNAPLPKRIDISDRALILVFDGSVREIPWSVVDTFVEDRTRWYIFPGAGSKSFGSGESNVRVIQSQGTAP